MNFVSKSVPHHLQEKVATDQQIDIFFFIDIHKGSLTADKVILFNLTEERSEDIAFEYSNRRLIIRPRKHLSQNTHYQIQLIGGREGIKDIMGRVMAESYQSEFYTSVATTIQPPTITSPTDLVEISGDVSFKWTPSPGAAYYEVEVSRTNTFQNLVWPASEVKIYETEVSPYINYEKGLYYMRARSVNAEGKKSHYTKAIQYYYSGLPQTNNRIVKEINPPPHILLETSARVISNETPINVLQQHFINELGEQKKASFHLIRSKPKHKGTNLTLNNNEIVLTFNQEIDPDSVSSEAVYVLAERN